MFTPGRLIFAVPSNETPPIVLAFCNAVAVAELPVQDPEEPEALPVSAPTKVVAVMIPLTLKLPVPVISLLFKSRLPPS